MRVIIIEDKDAKALLDRLDLTALKRDRIWTDPEHPPTVDDMHRAFRYVVVNWLHEQGAELR